jgi:hypothetical protein
VRIRVTDEADYTIMEVPLDKKFILTDIIASFQLQLSDFFVKQDTNTKIHVRFRGDNPFGNMDSLHLTTGITFSSGTDIVISNEHTDTFYYSDITITGHLLDN